MIDEIIKNLLNRVYTVTLSIKLIFYRIIHNDRSVIGQKKPALKGG